MAIINDDVARRMGENALSILLMLIRNGFVEKEFRTGSTSIHKTLSDNDLTDALKNLYDAAYSHSQTPHAPSDAQANMVEVVKVNGATINVENKIVDIPVPLISTDLSSDKSSTTKAVSPKAVYDYVTEAVNGAGLSFKILSSNEYDPSTGLPIIEGNNKYIYLVPDGESTNDIYKEYIYVNGSFECIGKTSVDLSDYMKKEDLKEFTTEEINALWTQVFST